MSTNLQAEASASTFQLTPPEVITPVSEQVAKTAVPMSAELQNAVEDQVERFMQSLLTEDVQSDAFKRGQTPADCRHQTAPAQAGLRFCVWLPVCMGVLLHTPGAVVKRQPQRPGCKLCRRA